MGLDGEIGAARMAARGTRWGAHLTLAATLAGMLLISGPLAQASAASGVHGVRAQSALTSAGIAAAARTSGADAFALPLADRTIRTGGIPAAEGRALADLSRQTNAGRHIEIGILLLIVSFMATTAFSLWRWQLRGLVSEARHRDA